MNISKKTLPIHYKDKNLKEHDKDVEGNSDDMKEYRRWWNTCSHSVKSDLLMIYVKTLIPNDTPDRREVLFDSMVNLMCAYTKNRMKIEEIDFERDDNGEGKIRIKEIRNISVDDDGVIDYKD